MVKYPFSDVSLPVNSANPSLEVTVSSILRAILSSLPAVIVYILELTPDEVSVNVPIPENLGVTLSPIAIITSSEYSLNL